MATVAYRATRSRRKFSNSRVVKKEINDTIDEKTKPDLLKKFEAIVANWETNITFRARKFVKVDEISVTVFPTGPNKEIWFYVSRGTRPHTIRARRAPFLVFVWGGPGSYKPKTTTSGSYGGPGVVVGGEKTYRKSVNHPGNEGREFEEKIRKEYKPIFSRDMNNAFRRGIRKENA